MRWVGFSVGWVAVLVLAYGLYVTQWANPRVVRELREHPQGERAKKVMLLTLPSGKALPVNYLRESRTVYCAADFPWWRELEEGGGPGSVLIQGETLRGHVRAVLDEPELRDAIFERLRPTAPRFLGTMVAIDLDEGRER
jgi:hypothetical protein